MVVFFANFVESVQWKFLQSVGIQVRYGQEYGVSLISDSQCTCNVAGVLEKYVQVLEKKHKFDLLKNLYASVNGRSIDDAQMVEFFKMKFWM